MPRISLRRKLNISLCRFWLSLGQLQSLSVFPVSVLVCWSNVWLPEWEIEKWRGGTGPLNLLEVTWAGGERQQNSHPPLPPDAQSTGSPMLGGQLFLPTCFPCCVRANRSRCTATCHAAGVGLGNCACAKTWNGPKLTRIYQASHQQTSELQNM